MSSSRVPTSSLGTTCEASIKSLLGRGRYSRSRSRLRCGCRLGERTCLESCTEGTHGVAPLGCYFVEEIGDEQYHRAHQ